jgi:hypothetical protein
MDWAMYTVAFVLEKTMYAVQSIQHCAMRQTLPQRNLDAEISLKMYLVRKISADCFHSVRVLLFVTNLFEL